MQMQGTDLWTSGEEGGMNWEASIDMYAPPCVKQLWEAAVQTGGSAQRSRSSPRKGGMEGREVQDGRDAHIQLAHSLCTRNSHNTVRQLSAVVQSLCMSNSLQPCGLQQARLLCSSPSPGVCSNSGPLSQ